MRKVLFKKWIPGKWVGPNEYVTGTNTWSGLDFDGFFHKWVTLHEGNETNVYAIIEDVNGNVHLLTFDKFRFNNLKYSNETTP